VYAVHLVLDIIIELELFVEGEGPRRKDEFVMKGATIVVAIQLLLDQLLLQNVVLVLLNVLHQSLIQLQPVYPHVLIPISRLP